MNTLQRFQTVTPQLHALRHCIHSTNKKNYIPTLPLDYPKLEHIYLSAIFQAAGDQSNIDSRDLETFH